MKKFLRTVFFLALFAAIFLTGCQKAQPKETDKKIEATAPEKSKTENNAENNAEIDEKSGLKKEGELELKYAKSFKVEFLEQGVKKYTDVEKRVVYFIPEGVNLDKDVIKIKTPVKSVAIFSTVDATMLRPLGELDKITATTTKPESWHIPEVKERLDKGVASFVGTKNAIDYELLQAINPDVIMFTYENLERTPVIIGKLDELKLNWIGLSNHMEDDPRARLEWIKLAGVLCDKEKEAESFFNEQVEKIKKIEEKTAAQTDKKTFSSVFVSKDIFYVRNAGDYNVKMFELAGGEYEFKDLNPDKNGNTKMNAEEYYKGAQNAEYIFYDAAGAPSINSLQKLLEYADFLKDLKAVKADKVWATKPHYYQSADKDADMIEEINLILNSEPGSITETDHFFLFSKEVK